MTFNKKEENISKHYSNRIQKWIDEYKNPQGYPFTKIRLERVQSYLERNAIRHEFLLDVGCGIGMAPLELVARPGRVHGFDVAQGLIDAANDIAEEYTDVKSTFFVGSALDPGCYPDQLANVAMAFGVFQHIEQDIEVLSLMGQNIEDDGLVIATFRNPLFALTTFNRPAYELFEDLFRKFLATEKADLLEGFLKEKCDISLPPIRKGELDDPGIDDLVYRYHNPLTVEDIFRKAGLCVVDLDFYRHHALPPLLRKEEPGLFDRLSLELDRSENDWRSMFLCSTYIVYARKDGSI